MASSKDRARARSRPRSIHTAWAPEQRITCCYFVLLHFSVTRPSGSTSYRDKQAGPKLRASGDRSSGSTVLFTPANVRMHASGMNLPTVGTGTGGCTAGSGFAQDQEELLAKRRRQDHNSGQDADMSELVENDLGDHKETANLRRGSDGERLRGYILRWEVLRQDFTLAVRVAVDRIPRQAAGKALRRLQEE